MPDVRFEICDSPQNASLLPPPIVTEAPPRPSEPGDKNISASRNPLKGCDVTARAPPCWGGFGGFQGSSTSPPPTRPKKEKKKSAHVMDPTSLILSVLHSASCGSRINPFNQRHSGGLCGELRRVKMAHAGGKSNAAGYKKKSIPELVTGFLSKLRSGRWATVRVDHMVAYEAWDTRNKLNASCHSSCASQETESESHLDSKGEKKKKNPMAPSVMPPPVIVHLLAETWKDSQMNYSLCTSTHAVGGEWKEEEEEKRRRVVERVSRFTQSAWRGH